MRSGGKGGIGGQGVGSEGTEDSFLFDLSFWPLGLVQASREVSFRLLERRPCDQSHNECTTVPGCPLQLWEGGGCAVAMVRRLTISHSRFHSGAKRRLAISL